MWKKNFPTQSKSLERVILYYLGCHAYGNEKKLLWKGTNGKCKLKKKPKTKKSANETINKEIFWRLKKMCQLQVNDENEEKKLKINKKY